MNIETPMLRYNILIKKGFIINVWVIILKNRIIDPIYAQLFKK